MCEDMYAIAYQENELITQNQKTKDGVYVDSYFESLYNVFVKINQEYICQKLGIDKYIGDMVLEYLLGDSNPEKWDNRNKIKFLTKGEIAQIDDYRSIIEQIELRKQKIFRKQKSRSIRLSIKRLFQNYNSNFGGIFYVDKKKEEMRFYIQEYYEPRDEYSISIPVRIDKSNSGHTIAMGLFFGKENIVENCRGEFFVKDNIFHFYIE